MIRIMAIVFGVGFIFAGVAGFLPIFYMDDLLFGLFQVDAMHNIVHLASGIIAIMAATQYKYSIWYFKIFGIVYGLVTIAGFVWQGDLGFMMMHMNMADNILHTVISVIALYLGFFSTKKA